MRPVRYDAPVGSLLRLVLLISVLVFAVSIAYRPGRWRAVGRRVRIVAFAYVAAILISTALRLLGVVDWS